MKPSRAPNSHFVPVDFEAQSIEDALAETQFARTAPTFFSLLGVTPYLTASAFEATTCLVAAMPETSGIAFDYAVARLALSPIEEYVSGILVNRVSETGESLQLFLEPDQLAHQLRTQGFRTIEDLGSVEINARNFGNRPG